MDTQDIKHQLESIRDNFPLTKNQQEALDIVIKEYYPLLTSEQLIRLIEITVAILCMTKQ